MYYDLSLYYRDEHCTWTLYMIIRKRPNRVFFHRTEPNRIWKTFLPNRTESNFGYRTEPNRTNFFLSKYYSKNSSKAPIKVFSIILKVCEKSLKKFTLKSIQFSWNNWKKDGWKISISSHFWTKNSVVRSKFSTEPNRTAQKHRTTEPNRTELSVASC